jgi:hypothetical protein
MDDDVEETADDQSEQQADGSQICWLGEKVGDGCHQ